MARLGSAWEVRRLTAALRRNVAAKLFAAAFAFMLWFFVNAGKRETEVFQFPIELTNVPRGTMLVNPDRVDSIAVKLNGPGALLASLDSRRSPIVVDLSGVEPGAEAKLKIRDEMIRIPRGVRILEIEPARLPVRLEEVRSAPIPVRVVHSGEPPPGYKIGTVRVSPAQVVVTGPASALEGLKALETAPFDVSGLTATTQRILALARAERLLSVAPEQVTAQIAIEQVLVSREFRHLEVAVRNVDRPFQLRPSRVNLTVRGPERVVQDLRIEDGSVYVDAAAYGLGEHVVEVEVALPPEVEVVKRDPAALSLHILEKKDGARR